MPSYTFSVQGSSPAPYLVKLNRDGKNLTAKCTCQAGKKGMMRKHRLALLNGDSSAVVSDNASEVAHVKGWLVGSDVEEILREIKKAERDRNHAKVEVDYGTAGASDELATAERHLKVYRHALAVALND